MLAKALTCAVVGLEGAMVEVEVDIGPGLPAFTIVGLPDAAVQEAKERVRAAVKNSGCVFLQRRLTVNLAPADLKKEGPALPTGRPGQHHQGPRRVTCRIRLLRSPQSGYPVTAPISA